MGVPSGLIDGIFHKKNHLPIGDTPTYGNPMTMEISWDVFFFTNDLFESMITRYERDHPRYDGKPWDTIRKNIYKLNIMGYSRKSTESDIL